jgi:hypothetical protein
MKHVRESGNKFHILVIIADGQMEDEGPTVSAIIDASKLPLSIVLVGVGDGPWDIMEEFDDHLPGRRFDNFQFVDFHSIREARNTEAAFALAALMEVPAQYKTMMELGYFSNNMEMVEEEEKETGDDAEFDFIMKVECSVVNVIGRYKIVQEQIYITIAPFKFHNICLIFNWERRDKVCLPVLTNLYTESLRT